MALDKLVDSTQLDSDLTSVANAIRTKGGTSASLAFPAGFVSAIGDIPSGGGGTNYFDEYIQGNISSYSSDDVTVIANGRLQSNKLTNISFPNLEEIKDDGCWSAQFVDTYFPKLKTLGARAFRDGKHQYFVLPALEKVGGESFRGQGSNMLLAVDIGTAGVNSPSTLSFQGIGFNNNCATLILRYATVVKVNAANSLSAPFGNGGSGGTIYIPKSLYDHLGDGTASDYKAASNWSTIDGYGTITWAKIEGSQYENYYADGTAIPT